MKKKLFYSLATAVLAAGLSFGLSYDANASLEVSGNHKKDCWIKDGCKFKVDKSCFGHMC